MTTVNDLLRDKDSDLYTIGPDATVLETLELMAEKNIGAVLVMDGDRLIGLMTERDYARKVALAGRHSYDTSVRDVMTTHVAFISPTKTVEECLALMTDKRFRHLPVMENDQLIGLVSIGDLVKAIIADQRFMIEQLEQYISGQ